MWGGGGFVRRSGPFGRYGLFDDVSGGECFLPVLHDRRPVFGRRHPCRDDERNGVCCEYAALGADEHPMPFALLINLAWTVALRAMKLMFPLGQESTSYFIILNSTPLYTFLYFFSTIYSSEQGEYREVSYIVLYIEKLYIPLSLWGCRQLEYVKKIRLAECVRMSVTTVYIPDEMHAQIRARGIKVPMLVRLGWERLNAGDQEYKEKVEKMSRMIERLQTRVFELEQKEATE